MVLEFFRYLQWDGAISKAMLYDFSTVMDECSEEIALDFLISLTRPPALISQLQVRLPLSDLELPFGSENVNMNHVLFKRGSLRMGILSDGYLQGLCLKKSFLLTGLARKIAFL